MKIKLLDRSANSDLDDITFAAWLRKNNQSENSIRNFWNLIIQPTLNSDSERASADVCFMIFQEGVLNSKGASDIGYAKVGLSILLNKEVKDYLGGKITLIKAKELIIQKTRQYAKRQFTWARGHMKSWEKIYSPDTNDLFKKAVNKIS